MATLLKATGETALVTPAKGGKFELKELQNLVAGGGYIEVIPTPGGKLLVFDEEGKFKDLPVNVTATKIGLSAGMHPADSIVGDVLWCPLEEFD